MFKQTMDMTMSHGPRDLWTLRFEFHIIFMSQKQYSFDVFPKHLRMWKTFLADGPYTSGPLHVFIQTRSLILVGHWKNFGFFSNGKLLSSSEQGIWGHELHF